MVDTRSQTDAGSPEGEGVKPPGRPLARRGFLRLAGTTVAGLAAVPSAYYYATEIEPHWFRVARRVLPVRGLPAALEGKKLLHLSDTHAGLTVDRAYLARAFDRARSLEPDIVVYTGDLSDFGSLRRIAYFDSQVGGFPLAPLGSFAILGNHDYGHTFKDPEVGDAVARRMTDHGIRMLRNEVVEVQGLQLAGLDDLWAGRVDGPGTLAKLDKGKPAIVLLHNPDLCDAGWWGDYQGWIFAGHTHGGQVKPPFLEPPRLPVRNRRYVRGEYDVGGGRRLFINVGLGHTDRVRFNVRPEMVLFELRRA